MQENIPCPLRVLCYLSHAVPHTVIHGMTLFSPAAWGLDSPSRVPCRPKGLVPPDSSQTTCLLASPERTNRFGGISSYSQSCLDSSPIDHICPCVHHGSLIQLLLICLYSITLAALWFLKSPWHPFLLKGHSLWHLPTIAGALASSYSFKVFEPLFFGFVCEAGVSPGPPQSLSCY